MKIYIKNIIGEFKKICIINRCLMLIMLLLAVFTFFSLVTGADLSSGTDLTVKNASAAIFGYFLSAGFSQNSCSYLKNLKGEEPTEAEVFAFKKQQAVIVAIICVVSLALLLIFKNIYGIHDDENGTVFQLRDFVVSSVGFLVGQHSE